MDFTPVDNQKVAPLVIAGDWTTEPATTNKPSVDTTGFDAGWATIVANIGTFTGASNQTVLQVKDSADDVTFANVTGALFTITAANDAGILVGTLALGIRERYLEVVATNSGTNTTNPYSVTCVLSNSRDSGEWTKNTHAFQIVT